MDVPPVPCLVEGPLDEVVVRKILNTASLQVSSFYLASLPAFKAKLDAFNRAARHAAWFALCDLDDDECAPVRMRNFLPDPAPRMCFRIAVRAVEAWLLADRSNMARFLSVSIDLIDPHPERLSAPKSQLISIARRSRSRTIRMGIVPALGDSRVIGPEYTLLMSEFVANGGVRSEPRKGRRVCAVPWSDF